MKEPGNKHPVTVISVLVLVSILSGAPPLIAQRSGSAPYPPPKTNQASKPYSPPGSDSSSGRRPFEGDGAVDPETRMLRRRAAAALSEDFKRLRQINLETIVPLSSATSVDYTSVDYKDLSLASGEINSRAKRIKSNSPLALKEKKGEKRAYETDASHLGSMLPELSRLIQDFLDNPVFYSASVHDDELRSTAGRDLENIIRLSDAINKIAKRLIQTPARSS